MSSASNENSILQIQSEDVPHQLEEFLKGGYRHILQSGHPDFSTELQFARHLNETHLDFMNDPSAFLTQLGGTMLAKTSFTFFESGEKSKVMGEVREWIGAQPGTRNVIDTAVQVADEMFTNTLFHAPVDTLGQRIHSEKVRSTRVEIDPHFPGQISLATNASCLTLACEDPFGSLVPEAFLGRLQETYGADGMAEIRKDSAAGAGLGCRILFENGMSLFVGVRRGVKTVFASKFPLHLSFRKIQMIPKSLHAWTSIEERVTMNKNLSVESHWLGEEETILFKGDIDEHCDFSKLAVKDCKRLTLNLEGVRLVNSSGLRQWVLWMRKIPDGVLVVFKNCPRHVIDQMNILDGFKPMRAQMESFFIPYACDSCGFQKDLLVQRGLDFSQATTDSPERPPTPSDQKCDACGKKMEMDVIPSKYFKFLKLRAK